MTLLYNEPIKITNTHTNKADTMTITQAQAIINQALQMGVIDHEQAISKSQTIRLKERYGKKMHWSEQARMRAMFLNDLPKLTAIRASL